MAALDDLIAIYKEAQLALIKIITGNTGAGTKTYYNTILRQLTALLNQLAAQTGRYISTEIPKEYKAALEQTYDYFKRNNLQMNLPEMFAQIHSDAVSELAAEMQHHITEGISSAGRRVMRYADIARDNALRQNGLRASAVKIASAQTVRDMQKDLIRRLSEDGFLTVQYGSGKYAYQVGLDSYAAMVARSTTREAGNLAREKQLLANGYDLVVITEHKPCCELCARVQGRVFSISGKDKRFPPLSAAFTSGYRNVHPNCRCVAVPWIEEMQSPEERRQALEKGSQPLRDERSDKEKALYTQQQSDRRQMRADLIQYERYKARLGSDAPKSFSAFRRMKNAGGDRWEGVQKKYRSKFEKPTAEERRELLSRNAVDVHNSSVDKSGGSGIIEPKIFYSGDEVNDFFYYDGEERGLAAKESSSYGKWLSSLSDEEKRSLRFYTSNGYIKINDILRQQKEWKGTSATIRNIDKAISSFELKEDITVYRGVRDFYGASIVEDDEWNDIRETVGKTFLDLGFGSSTALNGNSVATSKPFLFEIEIPAGKGRGAYINRLSSGFEDDEYEFLIARNSKFRIIDVYDNNEPIPPQKIIKMRMIVDEKA